MFNKMNTILLLVLSTCCVLVRVASAQNIYYILPNDESSCPVSDSNRCMKLAHLINTTESHTVFNFVGGNYNLEGVLKFMDMVNITIQGGGQDDAIIECNSSDDSGLVIMNVTTFVMKDISFVGCHVKMTQDQLMIDRYAKTFLNFSLPVTCGVFFNYLYDVNLMNIKVINSTGYGILAFNLLGNSYISDTEISNSNRMAFGESKCAVNLLICKGGNFALAYTDLLYCPTTEVSYSITIANSSFTNGVDGGVSFVSFLPEALVISRNDLHFIGGSGVGIQMMQSSYGVDVVIDNCAMDSNAAYVGANLYMTMWDFVDNSTLTIKNSTIINGRSHLETSDDGIVTTSNFSPGFYFEYGILPMGAYRPVCQAERKYQTQVFTMEDCSVKNNEGILTASGIAEFAKSFYNHPRVVTLRRVQFIENNGDATLVLWGQGLIPSGFKTYLYECEFSRNFYKPAGNTVIGSSNHQIVYQISMLYAEYINCTWRDNQESSLHAIQSRLIMTGENTFINNTGVNGGGLEIQEGSEVFLQSGSKTVFINNYARRFGGAIYALMLSYRCFFQLDTSKELPVLSFNNNTALLAGQAVYGTFRLCLVGQATDSGEPLDIFLQISSFSEPVSLNSSVISGDPIGLCLCFEGSIACSSNFDSVSYYDVYSSPGKEFTVQIEAYAFSDGDNVGGQTTAEVIATTIETLGNDSHASLKSTVPQPIHKGCNVASFALLGYENQSVPMTLSPSSDRLFFPAFIRVHLEKCPNGFVYSSNERSCACDPLLVDNRIDCNLQTNELIKASSQWIGYAEGDDTDSIIAIGTCNTVEYCGSATVVVLGQDDDSQCASHRSGTLCGQCQPGYSLALGSSECLECSNTYLTLLIFFILAGPLWIVFLSFFDVTVSTGRINGMLFYANVLRIANFEFFSYTKNPAFYIFQIMIDWINLDFGIVSCFYDGFDYYAKAWFNFAFPLYLFIILAAITICANRFSKFTHILPRNILSVLTTVILICFTKLLRSSFAPLPFQNLDTEAGDMLVWDFDGSLKYFGVKHGILFVFALLVLLLLVVPFAVILISYPYLQSFTAHEDTIFERFICFLRTKIFKFKPLLETYDGPYIASHRYYTGLQAVLRLIFLFVTASSYTGAAVWFKSMSIAIISLALLILVISKRIYLCPVNKFVEVLYLGNLVILEFILLILQLLNLSYEHQGIAVSVSVAVSFVIFICVLIYEKYRVLAPHIYKCLGLTYKPSIEACIQGRQVEEDKQLKRLDRNDQATQIIDLIDENCRQAEELNIKSKEQQLIQNLIGSNAECPATF